MLKKTINLKKFSDRATGNRPVTRTEVNIRTHELAALAGRVPPYVTQKDYEQAKRDVTGETDRDRQNAMLDTHPPEIQRVPLITRERSPLA